MAFEGEGHVHIRVFMLFRGHRDGASRGLLCVNLFGVIEERDDIRGRCSEEYRLRTDHAIPIPASRFFISSASTALHAN
jgi:hypothetical protein